MIARDRQFMIAALIGAIALGATSHSSAQTPQIDDLKARIAANPDAYELGAWQVELAEQLLATLSSDGADTSALFGIPSPTQLNRVMSFASDAYELTQRASNSLERGIQRIAEDPRFVDERELQDLRSALAVEFRLIRMPLAWGRARALLWAASEFIEAGSSNDSIVETLRGIEGVAAPVEAMRLATLGALDENKEIRSELHAFATDARIRGLRRHYPHVARELILAQANQLEDSSQTAQVLESQLLQFEETRPLDGLAAREFRLRQSLIAPSRNNALGISPTLVFDAITENAALASLVIEKCQQVISDRAALDDVAPIDRIAIGRNARARRVVDESIRAFQSAWDGLTLEDGEFKRLCGWDLARALRERGAPQDIANAGAVLLELAQLPNEPNAEQALTSSIQLLQWSDRALAQIGAERASVSASLRDALRLGLRTWPNAASADEWRLALANVVAGAEQRDLLESISPRSEAFPRARLALAWLVFAEFDGAPSDAQREALAFTMLQFADQAQETAAQFDLDAQDDFLASVQQARAVALVELRRFQAAAEAAIAWDGLDGRSEPDAVTIVRQRMGDALRESFLIRDAERAAAIATTLEALCAAAFQRILADASPRSTVDGAAIDLTDALGALDLEDELLSRTRAVAEHVGVTRGVGIAQATGLRAQGANAEAFQTLRDVVDASRVLEVTDDLYWRAWAGMLEILADQNQDGARTENIRRQIARLRAEDRALGGELTRRRIDAVETQLRRVTAAP